MQFRRSHRLIGLTLTVALAASCGSGEDASEQTTDYGSETSEQTTPEDVARETKEAVDEAVRLADQEREEFLNDAERRMDALNARLSKLRSEWRLASDEASEEAAQQWRRSFDTLEKERQEARETLERLREASGPAWTDIRKGFSKAYDDLSAAVDEAETDLKDAGSEDSENDPSDDQ